MDPLITLDDLEERAIVFDDDARAAAVLADVSAAIRAYTGQTFTLVEDEQVRLRARCGKVRLPQRPVVDVTAVANTEGSPLIFAWFSGEVIQLAGWGNTVRWFEVEPFHTVSNPWVDVTYTHGYDTTPDDVVAVACGLAASSLSRDPGELGVTQEAAGPFSRTFADPSPMSLSLPDRSTLDRYRRPIGTILVGR